MRHLLWTLIAISMLPVAARSQALPESPEPARPDATGWNRVADLARDEEITVARTGDFTLRCRFAGATGETLFCDKSRPWSQESFQIDRAEVNSVRLDRTTRNLRIIVGCAAAAGFVAGAAIPQPHGDNELPRYLRGMAGAAVGTAAGFVVAVPVAIAFPGRVIYRQPRPERSSRSSLESAPSQSNPDSAATEPAAISHSH